MKNQIQLKILPDGMIEAKTIGLKGSKCAGYVKLIEELLKAKVVDSSYTEEYYESQEQSLENHVSFHANITERIHNEYDK